MNTKDLTHDGCDCRAFFIQSESNIKKIEKNKINVGFESAINVSKK